MTQNELTTVLRNFQDYYHLIKETIESVRLRLDSWKTSSEETSCDGCAGNGSRAYGSLGESSCDICDGAGSYNTIAMETSSIRLSVLEADLAQAKTLLDSLTTGLLVINCEEDGHFIQGREVYKAAEVRKALEKRWSKEECVETKQH